MVQTGILNTEKLHFCSEVLLKKIDTTEKMRYLVIIALWPMASTLLIRRCTGTVGIIKFICKRKHFVVTRTVTILSFTPEKHVFMRVEYSKHGLFALNAQTVAQ